MDVDSTAVCCSAGVAASRVQPGCENPGQALCDVLGAHLHDAGSGKVAGVARIGSKAVCGALVNEPAGDPAAVIVVDHHRTAGDIRARCASYDSQVGLQRRHARGVVHDRQPGVCAVRSPVVASDAAGIRARLALVNVDATAIRGGAGLVAPGVQARKLPGQGLRIPGGDDGHDALHG